MPWPHPAPLVAGSTSGKLAQLNVWLDSINYEASPPSYATLQQANAQPITNSAVWTGIKMDGIESDPSGGHGVSPSDHLFTIPETGRYRVAGTIAFAPNATGLRGVRVVWIRASVVNVWPGRVLVGNNGASNNTEVSFTSGWEQFLDGGDAVSLQGFQSSGGSLSTVVDTSNGVLSTFSVKLVSLA